MQRHELDLWGRRYRVSGAPTIARDVGAEVEVWVKTRRLRNMDGYWQRLLPGTKRDTIRNIAVGELAAKSAIHVFSG